MPRVPRLLLSVPRGPKVLATLAIAALLVGACSEPSPLPSSPSELAKAGLEARPGNRASFPPDGWVFHPTQLPPGFRKYECIFEHPANIIHGPKVACQSKQWGNSGIYREQARDLVATGARAQELCGGPAHFDVTRLCSEAWTSSVETPWGTTGPLGCVFIAGTDLICGVA